MENKVPEEWIKQVEKQESNGKSITTWCKENGIAYSTPPRVPYLSSIPCENLLVNYQNLE